MEKKTKTKLIEKESLFSSFQREIDNEKLEHDIRDCGTSIRETCKSDERNTTINLDTNSNDFNDKCDVMLKAFDDAFETIYGDNEVGFIQVQQLSEELQSNCVHLINMIKTQKNTTEIEQLRSKYTLLENESLTTINKLQFQVTELEIQLKQQSFFSSNIGSTFGYYLWKATQIPAVVDMVLQEDKIINMAKIFTSILSSFVEKYNNQMPPVKSCETKFVLNILGIIANLTTSKSGCHFFTQISDGINVVNLIVSLVQCTPNSLKHNLKKMAYAALYNVSIQFNGHLLMENNKLIETLRNDLKVTTYKDINETLLFSLKLLHSLTRNMNESMCIIVKDEINLQEILKLASYTETELTARKIYENIHFAIEKYNIKHK